jgi:hypothetical protein
MGAGSRETVGLGRWRCDRGRGRGPRSCDRGRGRDRVPVALPAAAAVALAAVWAIVRAAGREFGLRIMPLTPSPPHATRPVPKGYALRWMRW